MAPPLLPRLVDDVIGEILLRLPPDEPACLFRASLVCKRWRSLVSDRAFLREYRSFHRTPPMLGFFYDRASSCIFVPTTTMAALPPVPRPAASAHTSYYQYHYTLDCRHGRVLFDTVFEGETEQSSVLTVWDPLTGDHECFPAPPPFDGRPCFGFTGAVLCASSFDGCNHLECSRGPFLVVTVDADNEMAWARVYSSETSVWGAPATIDVDSYIDRDDVVPNCMVVGGAIYFMLVCGKRILKYDMLRGALLVMKAPPQSQQGEPEKIVFAAVRDGELGAATLEGYSLHLWSWRAADDGEEWAPVRVIELDTMIQFSIGDPGTDFELAGFAQGAGLIFVSVNYDDMFTVELKSGHIRKTSKKGYYGNIFPLMRFCTPDCVSARLQLAMMTD